MKKNDNIVKYPKALNFNLGLAIFVVIFVYLVINLYNYYTAKHITYYEVDEGSIQMKTAYSAMALRDEKLVYAGDDGKVNYYLKDNSKAKMHSLIASIDETGSVSNQIDEVMDMAGVVTAESAREISKDIYKYIDGFDASEFYEIYRFKDELDASLMEAFNLSILNSISDYAMSAQSSGSFHVEFADQPGIVAYYMDGYESVNEENFTPGMLDKTGYVKDSLKGKKNVKAGDPIYKIIGSEDWKLVMEVDENLLEMLGDETVVKVHFREDDTTAWSYISTREIDNKKFLILSLNNSMLRYASERFIDIDIVTDRNDGLKIPNSAIVKKTFYTIPEEMFTDGGDTKAKGVMLCSENEDGETSIGFHECTIYLNKDGMNYICEDAITNGSKLINPVTGESYTVAANAALDGVYNVNKGFAVFKIINSIFSNEEYSIIAKGTKYGVAMYDHIALDASLVEEGEILNL